MKPLSRLHLEIGGAFKDAAADTTQEEGNSNEEYPCKRKKSFQRKPVYLLLQGER